MKKNTLRTWIILALGLIILVASLYTVISQSSRTEPQPTETLPTGTQPTETLPTETQPTETQPTEPLPTEPQPTETQPTEPLPTEPQPTEPPPTEPLPTEPQPTEPLPTEPQPTEPLPTEPQPTETQPPETLHQHSYTQTVKQPTCTAKGYTTYTCSCGDTYTDNKKAALGHDYKDKVVAPTYDSKGYTQHTCSRCGNSYKDNYTDKLVKPTQPQPTETQPAETQPTETVHQHSYTKKVTKPTCTAKGYTTYTCACGDTYKADEVSAAGHQYEDTVTKPTCTEKGYTTHTCSVCGDSYTDSKKSALGHNYKSKVVAPTFDAKGYTKYTCSRCGKTYKDKYTDKLTATLLLPEASGTLVKSNKYATIDYSHSGDGYVMVKYTEDTSLRLKVQVIGPSTTYTYDIQVGQWAVFPLSEGNGSYKIKVLRNKSGNTYSSMLTATISVELADKFAPFLRPNQYVNYENATKTITKAATLVAGKTDTLDKVEAIFKYVTKTLSYDYDKLATVASGYVPDLDKILASKKGICLDYAALMTAMLRTQDIPCKLVVGYADDAYHAWISVWSPEKGWVEGAIYFNGKDWQLMDPTYTSTTGEPTFTYITYTTKYLY